MSGGYFTLPARTLIRVTGGDALRYLNGQLSNDLRKLAPGQAMRACLLTAKGKLVADPFVWREAEAFLLEAHADLADALLARLERYLVADDVTLEPIDSPPGRYHFPGVLLADALTINRLGLPGSDVAELPVGSHALEPNEIEQIRIRHAQPVWGRELDEDVLPAEAGLDRLAVDFHKGCYVGQEIVSRIESVGRVKRQLAVLETRPHLVAGTALALSDADEAIGKITSSSPDSKGPNGVALAWLPTVHATVGTTLKPALNQSDVLTEIKVIEKLP